MERFFLVYKTANTIKDEYYIGIHITDDIEDGHLGSGKWLMLDLNSSSISRKELLQDNREDS